MTNDLENGSIQSEPPVHPVWPYEPTGKYFPRGPAYGESISQPSPRRGKFGGLCTEVKSATVSALKTRLPARSPAMEHHAGNPRHIARGEEHPGGPRHAVHAPRGRIM